MQEVYNLQQRFREWQLETSKYIDEFWPLSDLDGHRSTTESEAVTSLLSTRGEKLPAAQFVIGMASLRLGQNDKARASFDRAQQMDPMLFLNRFDGACSRLSATGRQEELSR